MSLFAHLIIRHSSGPKRQPARWSLLITPSETNQVGTLYRPERGEPYDVYVYHDYDVSTKSWPHTVYPLGEIDACSEDCIDFAIGQVPLPKLNFFQKRHPMYMKWHLWFDNLIKHLVDDKFMKPDAFVRLQDASEY